ncbi:glucokinase [Anseongella ginsenosidimutans]|uniref:Glucokinase n=1 Tax=Anseongella ginsenosidimutans TaxID=496056 RepID=A0A4R3KV64_9SPHI|nr:ROK family protein [Anseongella ginsenosidimutans]QEC53127.1 ROK family protein [Anseongella ginsenosidimutans]TCS87747.1 glucokinase [Anseongella ginsenosidimutans]
MILAIDIGGTSSKFGLVSPGKPEITEYRKLDTPKAVESRGLAGLLEAEIGSYLQRFPDIDGIGMGLPGLLSKDRREILELPNIPQAGRLPILDRLEEKFPGIPLKIENDAKCATLGEFRFGKQENLNNFLLVTLGTGIGSGVIIDGRLFKGACGNGLELGHILVGGERTLEEQIGLPGFLAYAGEQVQAQGGKTVLQQDNLSGKAIFDAATQQDTLALSLFAHLGKLLGEGLVAAVRLLDVTNLLIGGGVSGAFGFIHPSLKESMESHLPPYYTSSLKIRQASLGNDAGLLGAAGLFV